MTVDERVAKGYAWLKANRPTTVSHLNPETIDVESTWDCPLGQTGDYHETIADMVPYDNTLSFEEMGLARFNWAHAHGFAGGEYGQCCSDETLSDYTALNAAWGDLLI